MSPDDDVIYVYWLEKDQRTSAAKAAFSSSRALLEVVVVALQARVPC